MKIRHGWMVIYDEFNQLEYRFPQSGSGLSVSKNTCSPRCLEGSPYSFAHYPCYVNKLFLFSVLQRLCEYQNLDSGLAVSYMLTLNIFSFTLFVKLCWQIWFNTFIFRFVSLFHFFCIFITLVKVNAIIEILTVVCRFLLVHIFVVAKHIWIVVVVLPGDCKVSCARLFLKHFETHSTTSGSLEMYFS